MLSGLTTYKLFLSDEGPTLGTLDFTIHISSTLTFLYFDLYLYSAYVAHALRLWLHITYIKYEKVWYCISTDLKNRTGPSIYCWETEANGGHIGVSTWGVQWRHRDENENFDIFYLELTNEMCSLDIN